SFSRPFTILAVTGEHSLHDTADLVITLLYQEVNVVRHQAISVKVEQKLRFLNRQDGGQLDLVVSGTEDLLAIIAARDDVVEAARYFDPRFPGHKTAGYVNGGEMLTRMSTYQACPLLETSSASSINAIFGESHVIVLCYQVLLTIRAVILPPLTV